MTIPQIKGILFDFDGVLANTMEDLLRAWQHAFRHHGIEITKEDYFPLEGMKGVEVAKTIAARYNLPNILYSEVVERKNQYYLQNNSFCFYPGVVELIEKLHRKGMVMGIVTASPRRKLEQTVPTEFLQKFQVIVSGDDAGRGKPFPDPYLTGLQKLGLGKDECLVIENAPLGIQAAKSAGLYCIAITSTVGKEKLQEADEIVEEFNNLNTSIIDKCGNKDTKESTYLFR